MGIDHGLEGKNSEKSKLRRERKAKQVKKIIQKLVHEGDVGGRRNEVKFDENARQAWLTGFRKRKTERRKYGLTMQVLKQDKQKKEMQKLRTKTLSSINSDADNAHAKVSALRGNAETDLDEDPANSGVGSVFDDEDTVSMFGGTVNVTIDQLGNSPQSFELSSTIENEAADGSSVQSSTSRRHKKPMELSRFDRAMKKVKQTMGTKARKVQSRGKNTRVKGLNKKVESRKLVEKALGRKIKRREGRSK